MLHSLPWYVYVPCKTLFPTFSFTLPIIFGNQYETKYYYQNNQDSKDPNYFTYYWATQEKYFEFICLDQEGPPRARLYLTHWTRPSLP